LLLPRSTTIWVARTWAWLLLFGLRWIAGLHYEVRGRAPAGPVIIASKHFSMWETIAFMALVRDPAIVMKRALLRVPLYGWYCLKMKMIPIDRSARGAAIRAMHRAAVAAREAHRPILIFPEGTRKKPGDAPDYKPGVAGLYTQLKLPCVPVAHNSGLFWSGPFLRKPGTVVVEFLEPLPPGLPRRDFLAVLETRIETASQRLVREGLLARH
jgi:1-acyl-sn-glycerol-3-phosphate acyltransferase